MTIPTEYTTIPDMVPSAANMAPDDLIEIAQYAAPEVWNSVYLTGQQVINGVLAQLPPTPPRYLLLDGSYAYGGGADLFTMTIPGVLATDHAWIQFASSDNQTALYFARAQLDGILVSVSLDPGSSQILYQIWREFT